MSVLNEYVTLDPKEFIDGRTELDLDRLGIKAREIDWGDAEMEVFYIRQELGQIPAERHPPNRTVTMKLRVQKEDGVGVAEAMYKLQQKIGRINEDNGWIARNMSSKSKFKYKVGFEVYKAVLGGLDGWMLAHRESAPEVTLVMEVSPYCYGPEEFEATSVEGESGLTNGLEGLIENAPGTAPGKIRFRNKNNGTLSWLGMMANIDQVNEAVATNKLIYRAKEMTALGGATNDGEKISIIPSSAPSGTAVMSSKLTASGHLTHLGGRRILIRVNSSGGVGTEDVWAKLEWRALAGEWESNDKQYIKQTTNVYSVLDLGEANAISARVGSQRWEFRIILGTDKSYGAPIYLFHVFCFTQKQFLKLSKSISLAPPTSYLANGLLSPDKTAGTAIHTQTTKIGGAWGTSGSAKGDFTAIGSGLGYFRRKAKEDTEARKALMVTPLAKEGLLKVKGEIQPVLLDETVSEHIQWTLTLTMQGEKVKCSITRIRLNLPSYLAYKVQYEISGANVESAKIYEEVATGAEGAFNYSMAIVGNKVLFWKEDSEKNDPILTANLTTSESGKIGLMHYSPSTYEWIHSFNGYLFSSTEFEPICSAERMIDIGTDGIDRQHPTEDVWGNISINEGFYPKFPPGGMENRDLRWAICPSLGNYGSYDDPSGVKAKTTPFYRPAYHFASEAA